MAVTIELSENGRFKTDFAHRFSYTDNEVRFGTPIGVYEPIFKKNMRRAYRGYFKGEVIWNEGAIYGAYFKYVNVDTDRFVDIILTMVAQYILGLWETEANCSFSEGFKEAAYKHFTDTVRPWALYQLNRYAKKHFKTKTKGERNET